MDLRYAKALMEEHRRTAQRIRLLKEAEGHRAKPLRSRFRGWTSRMLERLSLTRHTPTEPHPPQPECQPT